MSQFARTMRVDALTKTPPGGVKVYDELRRLMPRDRRILNLLGTHKVLTTEQIFSIEFTDVHTARNRLDLLRKRGVLARFRDGVRPGSQQWRWTLDLIGAAYLAYRDGQPEPRLSTVRAKINALSASPRLAHLLEINEFFTGLMAHARTSGDAAQVVWRSEDQCRQITGTLVYPDGFGTWTDNAMEVSFWLEMDLGTEPSHRLIAKLPGYAALARQTGRGDVAVLIRLHSRGRQESLHRQLAKHPALTSGLLVATSTHDAHPAGQVWQAVGHDGLHRLAALTDLLPQITP